MGVRVLVGTAKGAFVLQADAGRGRWERSDLQLKGWSVTAFARDAAGRTFAAVGHDVFGSAVLASDDLASWRQLEAAPRYEPSELGNSAHNRIIGAADPLVHYAGDGRYVDQIWTLHAVGDVLYAGVSEAGLFRSDDRGESWTPVRGLNDHPSREKWMPGFGGLCAHRVLTDGRDRQRIWVGISAAGVFRSDDGGRSFAPKNEGVSPGGEAFCVHAIAHDPQRADVIYRQDHRGVYRSDDGGDSWRRIEKGLPTGPLSDGHECCFGFVLEMDRRTGSLFLLPLESDSFRFPRDARLAVYRSRDGGESWQPLTRGLPESCYANVLRGAMALDGLDPCGVYFGTTAGSVYASADAGDAWSCVAADLPRILCVEALVD